MLDETELQINVYRNGIGIDPSRDGISYVRIVHLPTGLVAMCGTEKSQLQNKAIALAELEKLVEERGCQ